MQVEQSITGHGRPNMVREKHIYRADKDTVCRADKTGPEQSNIIGQSSKVSGCSLQQVVVRCNEFPQKKKIKTKLKKKTLKI